jgi:hypothetical protein
MSLITPQHLYDVRPATAASPPGQTHEYVRLSLFEEAWLQLPRRRAGDPLTDVTCTDRQVSREDRPRA